MWIVFLKFPATQYLLGRVSTVVIKKKLAWILSYPVIYQNQNEVAKNSTM